MPVPFCAHYVFFAGHSNCGAGVALKENSKATDLTRNSIKKVDDFMHLRNPQAAIPWKNFQTQNSEYQWFAQNAIDATQVELQPTNYAVNMTGFSAGLLSVDENGHVINDNERFPNIAQPNAQYPTRRVQPGGTFSLQSTSFPNVPNIPIPQIAMNFMHFWGIDQDGDISAFLIAKLDNEIKPNFGYKILFFDGCNGARDYSEVFTHGCFISTRDLTTYDESLAEIFIEALMKGDNSAQVFGEITAKYKNGNFTQKTYQIH